MSDRIAFLVSCVSRKRPVPSRARDLYTSPWFAKARRYVEATGAPWFILSARYGLVPPDMEIEPYEQPLNGMTAPQRREWASRVLGQLQPHLTRIDEVVIFAGHRYTEFLVPKLELASTKVELPLAGLRIGEQLRWFARRDPP